MPGVWEGKNMYVKRAWVGSLNDRRPRRLAGPPITNNSDIMVFLDHGVKVGLGVVEAWEARNLRWELAMVCLARLTLWLIFIEVLQAVAQSRGRLSERQAFGLASTELEELLGVESQWSERDLVVFSEGTPFKKSAKVAAIISPGVGAVDFM
jgi:hypothetical protein